MQPRPAQLALLPYDVDAKSRCRCRGCCLRAFNLQVSNVNRLLSDARCSIKVHYYGPEPVTRMLWQMVWRDDSGAQAQVKQLWGARKQAGMLFPISDYGNTLSNSGVVMI